MNALSNEDLELINMLEKNTGARANDVVCTADSVIFIIKQGDLGKAIGKAGANIQKLKKSLNKHVEVIQDSDDVKEFLIHVFNPVIVETVEIREAPDKRIVDVVVEERNKGLAIGRGGDRINKARLLIKRRFGYDDVKIL